MGIPTPTPKKSTCDGHQKSGIPILPLRYGLVSTLKGNEDSPPIKAEPGIAIEKDSASFTWRVLHEGFLYVYLGKQKQLDEYLVSEDGYFMLIKPGTVNLPVFPAFSCVPQHSGSAGIITVPYDSEEVWIGFSDVRWTPDVRAENAKPEIRDQHMRKVSPKDWPKSKDWRHCFTVKQIENKVAEYRYSEPQMILENYDIQDKKSGVRLKTGLFLSSPFYPKPRLGWAKYMTDTCEKLAPGQGFAVALNDAVATASEIASLMAYRAEAMAETALEGKGKLRMVASVSIDNVRELVRARIQREKIINYDAQNKQIKQASWGMKSRPELKAKQIEAWADDEWAKYDDKKYFDNLARRRWTARVAPKIKKYNERYIAPLDKTLAGFLQGNILNSYLLHNFDRGNIDSGAVYVECVYRCIAGIQDKVACSTLLVKYLAGDVQDASKNFLLNALSWNQEELQKAIAKEEAQAGTIFDARQIGWDNILGTYSAALDKLKSGKPDAVGKILVAVLSPMSRYMEKVLTGSAVSRAVLINTGLIGNAPVVLLTFEGTREQFQRLLVTAYTRAAQGSLNMTEQQLSELIEAEMKRQMTFGTPVNSKAKNEFRYAFSVDDDTAKALGMSGPSHNARVKAVLGGPRVFDMQKLETVELMHWRKTVNTTNMGVGLVTGALQLLMYTKTLQDYWGAMKNDKDEALVRMVVGGVGLFASAFDTAFLPVVAAEESKLLVLGRKTKWVLKYGGKILGAAVGLVTAVLDGIKANDYRNEGDAVMYGLYAASAVVGTVTTVAFFYVGALSGTLASLILLLLVAVSIVIGVMTGIWQADRIQEWLKRTPWGSASDKYETDEELKLEFEKALKG